ncbi:MAG: hypothetical protein E7177_05555 [Erysipelotrichaceae bacterium]|nr:hypothetical protein [Erysipelotrichaceae bacterium]
MVDFLKTMGQGILYTILSPFIILGVLIYAVYCLFAFFFMFIKRIVMFFKGEDMSVEMKIDRAAKMHLDNQDEELEKKENEITPTITQTNVIKEEKTTIVQPIIIQTDEQGRLKNIQYITPSSTPSIEEKKVPQIEVQPLDNIEKEEE